MWALMPSQGWPFFHTTVYLAAPSSIRDPSVNIVSPGRAFSASTLASASSSCSSSASKASDSSGRTMLSVYSLCARAVLSRRPIPVGAPTISRPWFPCGRLSSRNPNRRCLFPSCVGAALRLAAIERAPRLVVRKQPVVARASWFVTP